MDRGYVAGFFDGEGSAMLMTIKRRKKFGFTYRFRPIIRMFQRNKHILEQIKSFLGYGYVGGSDKHCWNLEIAGSKNVCLFVDQIAPHVCIKQKQLFILKRVSNFQDRFSNIPYTRSDMKRMLDWRDALFKENTLNRKNIKQKYLRDQIMSENVFVDIKKWKGNRRSNVNKAVIKYFAERRITEGKEGLVLCSCGCGKEINAYNKKLRRWTKYARGHNSRWRKNANNQN